MGLAVVCDLAMYQVIHVTAGSLAVSMVICSAMQKSVSPISLSSLGLHATLASSCVEYIPTVELLISHASTHVTCYISPDSAFFK